MTCRELADFLMDYVSGELPDDVRAHFDRHIEECPDCLNYVETYRQTIALERAAFNSPDSDVPDSVPEHLIAAILASRRHYC